MDVDTISKYQTGVFNKMHSIPFHSLLPNGLLLTMGFTLSHKAKLETSYIWMWILYQKTKRVSSARCTVSPSILYYPMVSCWTWDLPILLGIDCLRLIVYAFISFTQSYFIFPLDLKPYLLHL